MKEGVLSQRQLFLQHLAQTTDFPMALEIERSEGVYLYARGGKKYLDLISGISVSNVGHRHPGVLKAIQDQLDRYMHLMVYGEYIQDPQVRLAKALNDHTAGGLNSVYFVNSGSEAVEGALKLAKRHTGRTEIISMQNAYHGSTAGALSIIGSEDFKRAFRPLIPGTKNIRFNNFEDLEQISAKTAGVIVEPVQGEAGYIPPAPGYLKAVREKCTQTGALLIFDEVQTGFGRTGEFFAHLLYKVNPDIITMAKGMGGGMPIGAFMAAKSTMDSLKNNPILGHITTFGGHPVSCAASFATLQTIFGEGLMKDVPEKNAQFRKKLIHPAIEEIRGEGLMLALQLDTFENVQKVITECIDQGLITDWFLFCENAIRISPPLTIRSEEIDFTCDILMQALVKVYG